MNFHDMKISADATYVTTIIYKSLPKYRIPFFEALRPYLNSKGIELRLIYGQPSHEEQQKGDTGHIEWGHMIHNRIFKFGPQNLYWQPCFQLLKGTDLIIVEQASKLLLNYALLAKQWLGGPKLGMWGHGRNFKVHSASLLGEAAKRQISRRVHWWFAYNNMSSIEVRRLGFPEGRITIVQNTIDTGDLYKKKSNTSEAELSSLRSMLGINSNNVAIYAGGMYAEKRIGFLLETALEIRRQVSNFHLLVIGAGPDAHIIQNAAKREGWIHFLGPQFNGNKVPFFMLSKVMLLPGLVGLAVIDSFTLEVPLVTIDLPYHSPEIEYLGNGKNGLKLEADTNPKEYAQVVVSLLNDETLRAKLIKGCRLSAKKYTLEKMVKRFARGVVKALNS